ncbi:MULTISPECIES: hypothetical protein [Proteus]|uniref:hypothetical protein n=1 Tax=Proteus TaxID=583 RepID=UPI0013786EDA|nr:MULTISPECIES: hypothetical protein [Proteus]MCX2588173.1 hypothetical protein [Proteus penneri]NBL90336.1 hypothetical protein [Proteus sp. G2673]
MTNKLKEEINAIQGRAAMANIDACIMVRLSLTIQIASFLIEKGKTIEAKDWLLGALEWGADVNIFDDLDDSDGSSEDIQAWFDKRMEGEISFAEAIELIRKHYTELEKLRTA